MGSQYHVDVTNIRQTPGVAVVLTGTDLLEVEEARMDLLAPLHLLLSRPGTFLTSADLPHGDHSRNETTNRQAAVPPNPFKRMGQVFSEASTGASLVLPIAQAFDQVALQLMNRIRYLVILIEQEQGTAT